MSRARRPKHKGSKKSGGWQPRAQASQKSYAKKWISHALWVLGIFGTFLGIYAFWVPRLSIATQSSLDPNNPLATPFVVSNNGYLPVFNVDFICGIGHLDFANGSRFEEFGMTTTEMHEDRIGTDEQATVRCDWMVKGSPITDGDISIIVKFEPFMFPKQRDKSFRFVSVRNSSGNLQWIPKPLSK